MMEETQMPEATIPLNEREESPRKDCKCSQKIKKATKCRETHELFEDVDIASMKTDAVGWIAQKSIDV
jgi:hypothetical protein